MIIIRQDGFRNLKKNKNQFHIKQDKKIVKILEIVPSGNFNLFSNDKTESKENSLFLNLFFL